MNKFISGGFLSDSRTHIMAGVGTLSAIAAYLVGDTDVFAMLQAIFTICGIYFLRHTNKNKGNKHGKNSRKIQE